MAIDRSTIRVKAMLITPHAHLPAHAVALHPPTLENPLGYHRLIGGTVELGESHRATIVREVHEELGATIHELTYLAAVENIFELDGVLGHEIVFVYSGRLDPAPADEGATLTESDGSKLPIVWRSLSVEDEPRPLYPPGAELWLGHSPEQNRPV